MFKHEGTKQVLLTPELAKEFADMRAAPGERPLSPRRVNFLQSKLQDGLFFSPRWAVVVINGVKYRINGQQSSNMLASCNGMFPENMQVIIDEWSSDDFADLPILFAQYDSAISSRTAGEIVNSHGRIHSELSDATPTTMLTAVNGIAYALADGNGSLQTVENKARLIHTYRDFVLWSAEYTNNRALKKIGTVAAMFLTWQKHLNVATEFWSHVRDESHPDTNNATRTYARFLREDVIATNRFGTKKFPTRGYFVKGIHAWNAYRTGATTNLRYTHDTAIPKLK